MQGATRRADPGTGARPLAWALAALLVLTFVPLLAPPAAAGQDKHVYRVDDIEATTVDPTGWERLAMLDDMGLGFDIGPMPFFDRTVEKFWIISNGFVALGDYSGNTGFQGGRIPNDDGENGLVAAAWTDLDPSTCGEVYRNFTQDRFRVAFVDVPYFGEPCTADSDRVSYRVEAWRLNGTFEVHLLRADGGQTATSGIEDHSGTEGNQTRRTDAALADPVAWRFTRVALRVPLEQDDAGSGGDAGDSQADALAISPGSTTGTLDPEFGDDEDWYAFDASFNDTIAASMDPVESDADFDLELYDPSGALLDASSTSGSAQEQVGATAADNGTHYLRVLAVAGQGDYTLTLDVTAPGGEDPPPTVEPRVETFAFQGDIDCAVVVDPFTATNDLCDRFVPEFPDRPTSFPIAMDAGVTSVHVEVHWDPDDALRGATRLRYDWTGFGSTLAGDEGAPPIVHDQTVASDSSLAENGGEGLIGVQASRLARGPLVAEQPFTLCVAVLYGGADLPADYACGP